MGNIVNTKKVTVLMPVYNGEKYLKESIDSILTQTFPDFEFLIIDDGSNDNSTSIVNSFNDNRIKFIRNEKNIGLIASLNKGIEMVKGEYIARMDCDDISLPQRLEKQVGFLDKNPNVCVVAAHIEMINENGQQVGYWAEDMNTETIQQIHSFLPIENCIAHPTVMMRKETIKKIGYNKSFVNSEDWGLWLSLLAEGNTIAKLDKVLLQYRVHAEGTTVKANKEGVRKKIIRFKYRFVKYKLFGLKFRGTDYKVLSSLIKDIAKYVFPSVYSFVGRIYSTNPIRFIKQYWLIRKEFAADKSISHIFFFPFYHIGGAELVHASILETVADRNPIVLITNNSGGTSLLPEYKKSAKVIEVSYLLVWPWAKKWLAKKVNKACSKDKNLCLFGSNSRFFYELISTVPPSTKVIDLIHAFMHEYEEGAEKWSLPVVDKLSNRIVINQKTLKDMDGFYKKHNVSESLLNKIVYIPNFTEEKKFMERETSGPLKALYAGRGTHEKRIHIISQAARLLAEEKANIELHFAGPLKNVISPKDLPFCILHGEITNKDEMNGLYDKMNILLISSSREGFPMVIMEAMMHGVVPVSTNVGGIHEHVQDKITGILIDAEEEKDIVNEIVKTIEYFLSHRNELNVISENAHKYAMENFSKKRFVESYQRILNS